MIHDWVKGFQTIQVRAEVAKSSKSIKFQGLQNPSSIKSIIGSGVSNM
jgi:hypothetical protein